MVTKQMPEAVENENSAALIWLNAHVLHTKSAEALSQAKQMIEHLKLDVIRLQRDHGFISEEAFDCIEDDIRQMFAEFGDNAKQIQKLVDDVLP